MFDRMGQAGILAAMRIMAQQATVRAGQHPAVTGLQSRLVKVVTVDAQRTTCSLEQIRPVRHMGGVTGIALAFLGRGVRNTVLPVAVDLVAAQAKARLLLEQIGGFIVAVCRVAGVAVQASDRFMSMLSRGDRLQLVVAGQANSVALGRQQGRLLTGVRIMTGEAVTLLEWQVPVRLMLLHSVGLVTICAEVSVFRDQQRREATAMRLVAARAVALHERLVLSGHGHLFIEALMTVKTELFLRHGQQGLSPAFVRLMAGQARLLACRGMANRLGTTLFGVTIQT